MALRSLPTVDACAFSAFPAAAPEQPVVVPVARAAPPSLDVPTHVPHAADLIVRRFYELATRCDGARAQPPPPPAALRKRAGDWDDDVADRKRRR
jgi:hypothetical protein